MLPTPLHRYTKMSIEKKAIRSFSKSNSQLHSEVITHIDNTVTQSLIYTTINTTSVGNGSSSVVSVSDGLSLHGQQS